MISEDNRHIARAIYQDSYWASLAHFANSKVLIREIMKLQQTIRDGRAVGIGEFEIRDLRQQAFRDAKNAWREALDLES